MDVQVGGLWSSKPTLLWQVSQRRWEPRQYVVFYMYLQKGFPHHRNVDIYNYNTFCFYHQLQMGNIFWSALHDHNNKIKEILCNPNLLNFVTELQWTAPELLRSEKSIDKQKVDIFSLGIILKEIFTRSGPYTEYPFLRMHGEEVIKY